MVAQNPELWPLQLPGPEEEIGNVDDIRYVKIMISESIYKNGMNVGVPCAFGEKGNAMAAAISLFLWQVGLRIRGAQGLY